MKTTTTCRILLLASAFALAACSGQGPEVIDPDSGARTQVSMLALASADGGELAIVQEPNGLTSTTAIADANGAPLDRAIDGIFSSFDKLFLLHRESGTISVVDVGTRMKLAEIGGFGDSASALCGMAFSNLSQGWVIDHNASHVYQIDAVNAMLVDTLPIEGRPTAVATVDNKVFVASALPDGSGLVSIFQSNFATFRIDETIRTATPVVFMAANGADDEMVLLSAGYPGGKPSVHVIRLEPTRIWKEKEFNGADLAAMVGRVPEFATISYGDYLYVSTPGEVFRIDVTTSSLPAQRWLEGNFAAIGVEYWTDLLYAYDAAAGNIQRVDGGGSELDPLTLPAPISAIEFVNPLKVP